MPTYQFKKIQVVPTGKDFVDIVLSKTQRQTPTVVHKGYAIARIRQFYMRKVKYTQSSWNDKLTQILEDFPRVDDIHPFYADLLNVLYDKDHYKLALGQINTARNLVDKVSKDYVKLLKYGDSLYRCKQLKRAALGRMCTLMKKQTASLAYLEQVRQHMARLPSIDPSTRTIVVCGYPNVGKSSFMNKVTRADVEVQPYAFTTKSLYVGHTDYKYLRWQVIDTPGILDRPLEERNTIEMQSVTALAHLRAVVLYVVDLSEQCGFTIKQQAALFDSIKPLFVNKPLVVALNKSDVRRPEQLPADDLELVRGMLRDAARLAAGSAEAEADPLAAAPIMSTLREEGVMAVKEVCCEKLLRERVEIKLKGRRLGEVMNRVHLAVPQPRDNAARPPVIPPGVAVARAARDAEEKRRTEKDVQEEMGGAGVYSMDEQKRYMLENDEWKHDIIPEIFDGKNVADFVDPEIEAKLAELEREEDELQAQAEAADMEDDDADGVEPLTVEEQATLREIRVRRNKLVADHRRKKAAANNNSVIPRSRSRGRPEQTEAHMREKLESVGLDATRAVERVRSQSRGRKRHRSLARDEEGGDADMEPEKRIRSSKSRSRSRAPPEHVAGDGFKSKEAKLKARMMADKAQRKWAKDARRGEADRRHLESMPKHLFSGKRGNGKTDRR